MELAIHIQRNFAEVSIQMRLLLRVRPSNLGCKASHTQLTPICLSEEVRKPFVLLRILLLSSEGKRAILVKKKAPSRSGFSASMHVVLKTRHVNPNIHVRRY